MSEDRTQPPSKRRRQLARQQGQAAHSPELTAAGGWLAAVVLLGALGDDLALGLTRLVRSSLTGAAMPSRRSGCGGRARAGLGPGAGLAAGGDPGGLCGGGAGHAPVAGARVVGDAPDRPRPGAAVGIFESAGSGGPDRAFGLVDGEGHRAGHGLGLDDPRGLVRRRAAEAASKGRCWPGQRDRSCSTWRGCWPGCSWSWDWSTTGCVSGGSRRCFGRRPRSSAKTSASWRATRPRGPSGGRVARSLRGDSPDLLAGASLLTLGPGRLDAGARGWPTPAAGHRSLCGPGKRRATPPAGAGGEPAPASRRPRSGSPAGPSPRAGLARRRRADRRACRHLANPVRPLRRNHAQDRGCPRSQECGSDVFRFRYSAGSTARPCARTSARPPRKRLTRAACSSGRSTRSL